MNANRRVSPALAMLLAVGVFGCAKVPTAEVESADRSMERARSAQAADYAQASLKAAEEARARLDAELKAQEEKNAMFRSYDKAKELAAVSTEAAERAQRDALEGRNRAREEAARVIAELRTELTEVSALLANAPRGKGSQVDLAALQSDLGGIERELTELDSAFAAERYLETTTRAQAVRENAERVEAEILRAMEASKKTAVRRG